MTEQTETRQLILDTAEKMFADGVDKQTQDAAERGEFQQSLWQTIVSNGFHQLGSEGSGTDAGDLFAFLQVCGSHGVPLPLADTLLVNRWCGADDGVASVGVQDGTAISRAVWGRAAQRVVAVSDGSSEVVVVANPSVTAQSINLAGEPVDDIELKDGQTVETNTDPFAEMALAQTNLIAGSLATQLDLGILFATERSQFGRSISKFQAIQHSLAVVAAEVAASKRAADAAVDAIGTDRFRSEVAASKSRVGEAVGVVAEQVHQIHGAMGFTHEHRLHHFSRRSWAWRDAWGNEFYWQQQLGNALCANGADSAWDFIATQN